MTGKLQGVDTAAALFELVSAEAQSVDEYQRLIEGAIEDVLARHPNMPREAIVFAAGVAYGRHQARQQCGCVAGTKQRA